MEPKKNSYAEAICSNEIMFDLLNTQENDWCKLTSSSTPALPLPLPLPLTRKGRGFLLRSGCNSLRCIVGFLLRRTVWLHQFSTG